MNPVTAKRATRPATDRWADIRGEPSTEMTEAQEKIDALHAAVLDTPSGRELVAHWRKVTIDRRDPPLAVDGALRESEACRRFVAKIETSVTRGKLVIAASRQKAGDGGRRRKSDSSKARGPT